MKNILLFTKKHWLLALVVAFVIGVTSFTSFAVYDEANSVIKRVIQASDGKSTGFTSNLLAAKVDTDSYIHRTLYRSVSDTNRYSAEVFIRNYEPSYPDFPYEDDISYDLVVTITDRNGNAITDLTGFGGESGKTISILDADNVTLCSLPMNGSVVTTTIEDQVIDYEQGKPGDKKYKVVFDNWDLDADIAYCVKLEAKLDTDHSYPGISDIGSIIGLKKNQEHEQNGWDAYFNEDPENIQGMIDAFNLILTGSGAADITIQWDPQEISLNSFFRGTESVFDLKTGEVEYIPPSGEETWETLIVHADANDATREYRHYYDIQVYSTGSQRLTSDIFKKLTSQDSSRGSSLITVQIVDQ